MSEDRFEGGRQKPVSSLRLIRPDESLERGASGQPAAAAAERVAGAGGFEFPHEFFHALVLGGQPRAVHHHVGEAGAHQRITQVVHVNESMNVGQVVD